MDARQDEEPPDCREATGESTAKEEGIAFRSSESASPGNAAICGKPPGCRRSGGGGVYPAGLHAFDMLRPRDAVSRETIRNFERHFEQAVRKK